MNHCIFLLQKHTHAVAFSKCAAFVQNGSAASRSALRIMAMFMLFFSALSHSQAQMCNDTFFVKFPDDRIVTACDGTGNYGAPLLFGPADSLLATSFKDDTFRMVSDACFRIERTWKIFNWCSYDAACGVFKVPNPAPNPIINNQANLPGPMLSNLCNAAMFNPWNATQIKITPGDPTATNYCTFFMQEASCPGGISKFNGYGYTQIIKIIDTQKPVATCLKPDTCDLTANDTAFWNRAYWWDARNESHNLGEMPIDLSITATDACTGPDVSIQYQLFLDLDNNGSKETLVRSDQQNPVNTIYYGNAFNANYIAGEPRAFDDRIVSNPALDWYRFSIQYSTSGNNRKASVRFHTVRHPATHVLPQLPHGKHRIKWIITDECGNETICEYSFEIRDCQKPTVVCKPLSVNIIQTKMVQLWASDFLEYAFDNVTPETKLKYGLSTGEPAPTQFPRDANGNVIAMLTFTCANLGPNVVQLWAEDVAGNASYCQVILLVQDNIRNCINNAEIGGVIKTETGAPIKDVLVELGGSHPAAIPSSLYGLITDSTGRYKMTNALPVLGSYTLCPQRDDNHLNGVTTLDLALISKHILNLEPLNSPYKIIAADANKSSTITTLDIVALRRLILGIDSELQNNLSWRFVSSSYVFPNPVNPFTQKFTECITVADIQNQAASPDFTGIKIGDVNGTAKTNLQSVASEDRTDPVTLFNTRDRAILPGDVFDATFTSAEKLAAQQFTLEFPGLEVLHIEPETPGMDLEHFALFPQVHLLTHAWNSTGQNNEQTQFTLRFRALAAGRLSKMLQFSDQITPSTAYTGTNELARRQPRLQFDAEAAKDAFVLYQNQPNPFSNATEIGFYLPQADRATLTILDETGKTLLRREGRFEKGFNTFTVSGTGLPAGMLLYQIEQQGVVLVKKMVKMN